MGGRELQAPGSGAGWASYLEQLCPDTGREKKLNDPRQSRGLIFVSPSKGQVHEPPEGG